MHSLSSCVHSIRLEFQFKYSDPLHWLQSGLHTISFVHYIALKFTFFFRFQVAAAIQIAGLQCVRRSNRVGEIICNYLGVITQDFGLISSLSLLFFVCH